MEKIEKKQLRKRLRPRSRSTKFVKLRQLECFKEIEQRITSGRPITQIVDFIQREKGEYLDVTRDSLVKVITEYRDQIGKKQILASRVPDQMEKWTAEARAAVDEVEELAKLFKLQMGRIEMEAKTEQQLRKLFKTLGQEVYYAMKILQTSASIKTDFGLITGARPTGEDGSGVNVNILNMDFARRFGSEAVQQVVTNPAARRKVLSLVERLSKLEGDKQKELLETVENEETGRIITVPAKIVEE